MRTGVICSPNNFAYTADDGELADNLIRITALADFDRWQALAEDDYRLEKLRWYDRLAASAVRFVPDFRSRVIDTDMFTPTTIRRFTGPRERRDLRRAAQAARRHDAAQEPLSVRHRPGLPRHRRLPRQRRLDGQPALSGDVSDCRLTATA